MEADRWYHWVVTYDGDSTTGGTNTRKFYMDGVHLSDYDATDVRWYDTNDTGGGENIYFGGRNNNGNFVKAWKCGLDEVAIFDKVIDVSPLYNSGTPSDLTNESGLVGYWRFEDNLVTDYSENGNHGTLTSTDISSYGLPKFSSDKPGNR